MEELDGIAWRKSSYSGANGAQCVEIGTAPRTVAVRDSKLNGTGPALRFTPSAWRRFADRVKQSLTLGPACGAGSARCW
jgi:hypothetical protein